MQSLCLERHELFFYAKFGIGKRVPVGVGFRNRKPTGTCPKFWQDLGRPKGLLHLYKGTKGHPKEHTRRTPCWPTLGTNPSRPCPPPTYRQLLRRSPAGIIPPPPSPRRRAAGIPRGSTTSAARWNGE